MPAKLLFPKIKAVYLRFKSVQSLHMTAGRPTLEILICTIAERLDCIPSMLMPERNGLRYVISVQYSTSTTPSLPAPLSLRSDVSVVFFQDNGLSRNRNNALSMATGEICLIADDDNLYRPEYIDNILNSWLENPDADILTFQAETYDGAPLHPYPVPYTCSVEISFRRESIISRGIKFDERFGLGSPLLCAGEEDVFMADARRAGLVIRFIPKVIVRTDGVTTSVGFTENKKLQISKGAAFQYIYGTGSAVWRSLKEAGWYLFHKGANPFPILKNMLKGIWILR